MWVSQYYGGGKKCVTWGVLFSFALMHLRHFNSNQIMNGTLQKLFTFKKSIIFHFFGEYFRTAFEKVVGLQNKECSHTIDTNYTIA